MLLAYIFVKLRCQILEDPMKKIVLLSILSLVSVTPVFGCNNGKKKLLIKEVSKKEFDKPIDDVKSCMDGRYLAVKFADGSSKLYDSRKNFKLVLDKKLRDVVDFEFSTDNRYLAVSRGGFFSDKKRMLQVYNLKNNGICVFDKKINEAVLPNISFSPDSRYLVATWPSYVLQLYDLKNGGKAEFDGKLRAVLCHKFIPNRKKLAICRKNGLGANELWFYNLQGKGGFKFVRKNISSFDISADRKYWAAKGKDKFILLDRSKNKSVLKLKEIDSFKFSPDSRYLAIYNNEHLLELRDLKNNLKHVVFGKPLKDVLIYTFSPDGRYLGVVFKGGSFGVGALQLYDLQGKKPKGVFGEKLGNIAYFSHRSSSFKFSPDSRLLLVHFEDDSSHLYRMKPFVRKPLLKLKADDQSFSKDGRYWFVAAGKTIKKFKLPGKKNLQAKKDFHERLQFLFDDMRD